ncbi:MAG: phage tail protein [Myxococcota bacterium]|nr:phage tail protein [Myxococcota bacterium]
MKEIRRKLQMPDLSGLSLRNARLLLEIMGFPAPDVRYEESYESPLSVIDQRPGRGQIVDSDVLVELVIAQRSFADYLPGIYRSSIYEGNYFLRDLLWVFRTFYDDVNAVIDDIPALFRPYDTPEEFLPWLSTWVAFVLDENWPEEKKRYLLRRAVDYYRIRGTVKGLKLYLSYFVGVEPEIIENEWPFRGFQIGVHSTMDIDSTIFPLVNRSHCFIVDIPLDPQEVDDQIYIKIHDIIRSEKPAHTMNLLRF